MTTKKFSWRRTLLAVVLILCVAVPLCLTVYSRVLGDISGQTQASIKNTVLQCAVQCYAIEGTYPPDLAYLEDNYGLVYNQDAYIVAYEAYASNELPDITVLKK